MATSTFTHQLAALQRAHPGLGISDLTIAMRRPTWALPLALACVVAGVLLANVVLSAGVVNAALAGAVGGLVGAAVIGGVTQRWAIAVAPHGMHLFATGRSMRHVDTAEYLGPVDPSSTHRISTGSPFEQWEVNGEPMMIMTKHVAELGIDALA